MFCLYMQNYTKCLCDGCFCYRNKSFYISFLSYQHRIPKKTQIQQNFPLFSQMYHKAVEKIEKIVEKIENDMNNSSISKSTFNIQLTQLSTLLIRYEPLFSSEDVNESDRLRKMYSEYKQKLKVYKDQIKQIETEEPVITNTYESLDTNYIENVESEFMSSSARRVENISFMALDSIDMLRKQKKMIDNARERIKSGLSGLGVSNTIIDMITNRYLTDYYFFLAGAVLILILLLLIKYYVI